MVYVSMHVYVYVYTYMCVGCMWLCMHDIVCVGVDVMYFFRTE